MAKKKACGVFFSIERDTSPVDAPKHITILHTNDYHSRYWHNDCGEYGLSAQKAIVTNGESFPASCLCV